MIRRDPHMTYTYRGKTFRAYPYEVPKIYLRRVKEAVGLHLMERCRRKSHCPFKPLLPEWEEEG